MGASCPTGGDSGEAGPSGLRLAGLSAGFLLAPPAAALAAAAVAPEGWRSVAAGAALAAALVIGPVIGAVLRKRRNVEFDGGRDEG